jgi:AraC-like DNA-binding protein
MTTACKIPVGLGLALAESGIAERAVLGHAGLPARLFADRTHDLPAAQYFALWHAITEVSGDPGIGIRLATLVRPDVTEPLFLAIMSAANVGEAIRMVANFKRMLEPEELLVVHDDERGSVEVIYHWIEGSPPQALTDAELAFLVHVCRQGCADPGLAAREVRLSTPALTARAAHERFFACPIRTGAAHNALVFDRADLARPFVTFNPELLQALLPWLQARLPPSRASTAARARTVLGDRLRGQRPNIEVVASALALSVRQLQRELREEGVSFRALLDDVRKEHARAYLAGSGFSDGEISFLLGFDNASSFYRAFRGWSGTSPGAARRLLREGRL